VNTFFASTTADWRAWLAQNFRSEKEVWLIIYHKDSGTPSVRYHEAIEHALCYGWIDSQARSWLCSTPCRSLGGRKDGRFERTSLRAGGRGRATAHGCGVTAAEQELSEDRATVPGMKLAVEAERLVKQYRGRAGTVDAVRGVDLRVVAGEVFGFLGPNGAGKSTTIRMLTTLMSITSGTARVAGIDVMADPEDVRRRIGVALQEAGLDPRQTGRELLVLQARLFGSSKAQAASRAEELLELVGLVEVGDRRIKGYSGGMKRRLDLASALVHEPDVLFLDEPTTGLDPASRLTVWDEVRRINARGTTVFLTTQYLEEADQLCDRLAIIDGGLIVREGTPEQLKAELRQRRDLDADPTLDEVFLDATGRTRERLAGEVQEVSA
jgi:ABC-2 type transport system ATP-binding protein